jgi:hypothetical protein
MRTRGRHTVGTQFDSDIQEEAMVEGLKLGSPVHFIGYGGTQIGTVVRIGKKNVLVTYITRSERRHAERVGIAPTPKRRSYSHAAFFLHQGRWVADRQRAFAAEQQEVSHA